MYFVILDTSSSQCLLAVGLDEKIIAIDVSSSQRHQATLLPTLARLLAEAGASQEELGWIAVGKGPGSYTGTRAGLAAAQALAFALEIPLLTFCSPLAFLPLEQDLPSTSWAAIWPTKMGSYYLLQGELVEGIYHQKDEGQVVAAPQLQELLAGANLLFSPDPGAVQNSLPLVSKKVHLATPSLDHLLPTLLERRRLSSFSSPLLISPIYYA